MATEPNDLTRIILRRLGEELEADVALANNLLDVLTQTTGNDMRNSSNLVAAGNELLRTIAEKEELIRFWSAAKPDRTGFETMFRSGSGVPFEAKCHIE
ncbi:hypothetical protein Tco_0345056 [Tanacetum coccineum]